MEKLSPCKVNLLLNILGKRADGFHELETLMQPVNLCDRLTFERATHGLQLSCSDPALPVDGRNLVCKAAEKFLATAGIHDGVRIQLEKKIPMAAGLGGGSGNAATTLLALNELFGQPLPEPKLGELAASLGSDINFFLQHKPALATGRGEKVESVEPFPALSDKAIFLIHPGFGISTPWAYQNLARFPAALNGRAGRARELIEKLRGNDWPAIAAAFYNSLEAPAFEKFPVLKLYQEFLMANGALAALMSGSGSTTFAIAADVAAAEALRGKFTKQFGDNGWTAVVKI
ncbi:MAG TPA: 4-(cytidine 5'-diphospho)-2-C-methyl-D-erythritol kinase [Verrucomicrobiae bacterium]|nr:4-(cytidine 5'-diphospho)-2-C-methyl-D-erythritol kinase [Verrucomicrobiae bacterium]